MPHCAAQSTALSRHLSLSCVHTIGCAGGRSAIVEQASLFFEAASAARDLGGASMVVLQLLGQLVGVGLHVRNRVVRRLQRTRVLGIRVGETLLVLGRGPTALVTML